MTPDQHNKYLAYAHLGYAGLTVGMMALMGVWIWAFSSIEPGKGPPPEFWVFMGIFLLFITAVCVVPSLLAGYAILKRKKWAKVAGIIAAVMCSTSAPFGSAICAYTFWFLFSEPGKSIYDKPKELPPQPPNWYANSTQSNSTQSREREGVYTPSSTPPDWR